MQAVPDASKDLISLQISETQKRIIPSLNGKLQFLLDNCDPGMTEF